MIFVERFLSMTSVNIKYLNGYSFIMESSGDQREFKIKCNDIIMKGLSSFLGPFSNQTEKIINSQPILFTLIMLYQGVFSGNAIAIPQNLRFLFESKLFRFISLMLIAFSASKDIEYSLLSTVIFLGVMYAIKTPDERRDTGFI